MYLLCFREKRAIVYFSSEFRPFYLSSSKINYHTEQLNVVESKQETAITISYSINYIF